MKESFEYQKELAELYRLMIEIPIYRIIFRWKILKKIQKLENEFYKNYPEWK